MRKTKDAEKPKNVDGGAANWHHEISLSGIKPKVTGYSGITDRTRRNVQVERVGIIMRILIADDHDLVRDVISLVLEQEDDITTAVASDFQDAAKKICDDGPFDLVLLDFTMPGMNRLDGLERAMELNQGKPVALISGTADRDIAERALAMGAAGFLPKTLPGQSLVHAVRIMMAGEQFAPIKFMIERMEEEEPSLASKLSERERQVLEGIGQGLSNKEIARELELKEVTVKLHVKTLCQKLDARNRTHAAMIGRDAGLL